MNKSIRWLLTESRISNVDTSKVNLENGKLICYHLTSKEKWVNNNDIVKLLDSSTMVPDKEILPTDDRAQRIVKKITNDKKNIRPKNWEIEEFVIEDMISDPYTDTSGFTPGGGDYHGKGLYTCYKFNPSIARLYGNICLAFEIDISNFLITFEDLAKQVHGESWRIKDQLLKLYQLEERSTESIERYKTLIAEIPDSELLMGKSIQDTSNRTADISLALMRTLTKENITSFYDGVVLFGSTDGPVCVSFYPKYDAKLIGLGRLNKDRPDIVDWYDSLDDFLGGRAKLKQDFETINAIAEELTDPDEKDSMKAEDRLPFDMDYLDLTKFFRESRYGDQTNVVTDLFDFYDKTKSSGDNKKLEFFLKAFKQSTLFANLNVIKDTRYSTLSDEVIKLCNSKGWEISIYVYNEVFRNCNQVDAKVSEFFLVNAIKECLSEKTFRNQNGRAVVSFNNNIDDYLERNGASAYARNTLKESLYKIGPDLAAISHNAEGMLKFYKNASSEHKQKLTHLISEDLKRVSGTRNWKYVTPEYFNTANELLENVIDNLTGRNYNFNYEVQFVDYLHSDLPDVDYFSNKIDEFIASSFINNIEKIKTTPPKALFINTFEYIERKLGETHPAVIQSKENVGQDIAKAGEDIEVFIEKMNNGSVTNSQLKQKFSQFQQDISCVSYLNKQTKDWFKNFFDAVMNNITVKNIKSIGKSEARYLLAIIMSQDIELSKDTQLTFTSKLGKSDYESKRTIASYKYIDPDVFISLIGPDLKAGGMGPGLTFKGFEYTPNIYRLLYKHRKIVDLFCDVARPGLMKMIVLNLNDELMGHPNPPHTWVKSGKLKSFDSSYYQGSLPYLETSSEEIRISEAVNMNDIAWFEYFISRAKKSPKRGVANVVAKLEKNINDKKAKAQSTTTQSSDDLDPQLDLSHRKIVGNSLKEVYNIIARKRSY